MVIVNVIRSLAVGTVTLLGLVGALFIAGEGLSDPGGRQGLLLTVGWVAPMAVLVLLAVLRPAVAARVLPWALAAVAALVLADAATGLLDRSGPAGAVAMFVVAVPCGLLGRRRAAEAGVLVLGAAALQLVTALAQYSRERTGGSGPALGDALAGSTGILVVPLFVLAALLLLTALLERHDTHRRHVGAVT
jgi:hypothetical protein